jgi:small subunit ribosomal protein S4
MGDPRHSKKTYQRPQVPWQESRIQDERVLMEQYGLQRKQELYRTEAQLKNYKETAKRLATEGGKQATKEKQQLFNTVNQYGLLREDTLTDVLSITTDQLLGRRLQTLLVDKDLAKSTKQARQFINHRHITIDGETVSSPGYLVTVEEEPQIEFHDNSPYSDENHPERPQPEAHEEAERQGNTADEALEEERNNDETESDDDSQSNEDTDE